MTRIKPKSMSIGMIREILSNKAESGFLRHIESDFAIVRNAQLLLTEVVQKNVPYSVPEMRMGLIKKGSGTITVNLIDKKVEKGMLAFLFTGAILEIKDVSADFTLEGIAIDNSLMSMMFGSNLPRIANGEVKDFYLKASEKDLGLIEQIMDAVWTLVNEKDYPKDVRNMLAASLMRYYDHLYNKQEGESRQRTSRERTIFNRFIAMVNAHSNKERQLDYYADRLCITPRYLGTVVKQASGVTAKEWIDRAVTARAQVLLKHSNLTVVQIADELHFPTASFFCKFFKRMTGQKPQQYREY